MLATNVGTSEQARGCRSERQRVRKTHRQIRKVLRKPTTRVRLGRLKWEFSVPTPFFGHRNAVLQPAVASRAPLVHIRRMRGEGAGGGRGSERGKGKEEGVERDGRKGKGRTEGKGRKEGARKGTREEREIMLAGPSVSTDFQALSYMFCMYFLT